MYASWQWSARSQGIEHDVDLATRIFLKFREIHRSQGFGAAATDKAVIAPTGAVVVGPYTYKVVAVVIDNPIQLVTQESCVASDLKFKRRLWTRFYAGRDLYEQPWSRVGEED